MKGLAILVLCQFYQTNLHAGEAEALFVAGNKAYKSKEYDKAAQAYQQLINDGYKTADLEYNLGNAWYRQGSIGQAVLHYERALVLDAKHDAAAKNLAFIRSKINAEIEPLPEFFLTRWWHSARAGMGASSMGILALVCWWAGFGALTFRVLGKTRNHKKWGLIAGLSLLIISILPLGLAWSSMAYQKNSEQAILVQKTAILRSSPEENAQEVETVAEGTKLNQIKKMEGWWQVSLENGEIGWLPENAMERI
ncbi:MAG: SH3 domain-containing protein [Saprospiraceae bacterium]|nr:SH3 domain-containing protein [Saprospiraceae bacterium]